MQLLKNKLRQIGACGEMQTIDSGAYMVPSPSLLEAMPTSDHAEAGPPQHRPPEHLGFGGSIARRPAPHHPMH
ncbi:hypothetical protein ACVWYQ_003681 [Bradyrhizobium sp. USDA 3397]